MVHRTSSVQQIETSDDDLPLSKSKKAISTSDISTQQRIKNIPRRNSLRLSIDHQNFHLNKANVPPSASPIKKQKFAAAEKQRLKTNSSTDVGSEIISTKSLKANKLQLPPPQPPLLKQNVEVTVKLKRNECVPFKTNITDASGTQDKSTIVSRIHETDQNEKDENNSKACGIICRLPLERLSGIIETLTRFDNSSSTSSSLSNVDASSLSVVNRTLCLYCDRSFSSQKLLAKHTERIHQAAEGRRLSARKPNTSSLLYPGCSHCNNGKTTSLLADELPALFEHLVDIHFDKYFACKICSIRFTNKDALQQHADEVHANDLITSVDSGFKQPTKTPIYDKRKKKSLKSSIDVSVLNDSATTSINDDSSGIDDSNDTTLEADKNTSTSSSSSSSTSSSSGNSNIESTISLRSSRRQQEAKSSNNDLPPPKTNTPVLRKKQILSNESTTPQLSRLGIAQNRSPRTRRSLKNSRNNDNSETYRSDTPTGSSGGLSNSSSASSSTATPRSRNKHSRSNSATNVSASNTTADGVGSDIQSSTLSMNTQRTTIGGTNKVSTDTPSGTFDENFYESVCTNVRLNLSCHLDGKRESGPTSPSPMVSVVNSIVPAVSSTLVKTPLITDPELHEATALATVTAFPTLLTAHQYGVEPNMGKIKKPITKNSWKWKWDSAKKYKWFNEGGKMVKKIKPPAGGLRDLSRLDMWTQLSMRMRHEQHQRLQIDDTSGAYSHERNLSQSETSKLEKQKLIDQLSGILDRRVLPQINLEQNDQRIIKCEQIEQQEETNSDDVNKSSNDHDRTDTDAPDDLLSILRLNRVSKSTTQAATTNLVTTNNAATSTNKNPPSTGIILSGEWARPRCYICYGCGAKFETVKNLDDHQILRHPHVYTTHYEIVGKELIEGNLFRHFYIPLSALNQHTEYKQRQQAIGTGLAADQQSTKKLDQQSTNNIVVEDSMDSVTSFSASMSKSDSFDMDTNSRNSKESSSSTVMTTMSAPVTTTAAATSAIFSMSDANAANYGNNVSTAIRRACTKCKRLCSGRVDLYRHMLDCSGDYAWFLAKKRHNIKYRYFGARKRKVNRTNYAHRRPAIRPKKEESSGETTPRTKEPQTPKPRPSDAESIQRMLANLPAKRACRQIFPNLVQKRTRKLIATANTAAALRHKQILVKQASQSNTGGRSTRSYKYVTTSANAAIGKNINLRKKLIKQQSAQSPLSSSSVSSSPSKDDAISLQTSAQRKTRSSLNQNDSSAETQSNPEKNDDFMNTLRSKTRRVVSQIKSSFRRPINRTRLVRSIVNGKSDDEKKSDVNVMATKKDDTEKQASRSTLIRRALSFRKSRRKIRDTIETSQVENEKILIDDKNDKVENVIESDSEKLIEIPEVTTVAASKKFKGKNIKNFFKNIRKNCHKKSDTTTPDKDVQPYVRVTDVIKQGTFVPEKLKNDGNVALEKDVNQLNDKPTSLVSNAEMTVDSVAKGSPLSLRLNIEDESPKSDNDAEDLSSKATTKINLINDRSLHEDDNDTLSNSSDVSNTPSVPQMPSSPTIMMKTPPSAKRKPRKLNDCIAMLTGKLQEKLGVPFLENDCNVLMQSSVRSVHQAVMEDDDVPPSAVETESGRATTMTGDNSSLENTPKKRRGRKPKNLVMVQQRPHFNEAPPTTIFPEIMPIKLVPSIFDGIKCNLPKISTNFMNLYDHHHCNDDDDDDDMMMMEQEQPINLVVPKERHDRASATITSKPPTILSAPFSDAYNFKSSSSSITQQTSSFASLHYAQSSSLTNVQTAINDEQTAWKNADRTTTSELRKLRKTKSARSLSPSSLMSASDSFLKPLQSPIPVTFDKDVGSLDLTTNLAYKGSTSQAYASEIKMQFNQSGYNPIVTVPATAKRKTKRNRHLPPPPTHKETSSEILTRIINEVAIGPASDSEEDADDDDDNDFPSQPIAMANVLQNTVNLSSKLPDFSKCSKKMMESIRAAETFMPLAKEIIRKNADRESSSLINTQQSSLVVQSEKEMPSLINTTAIIKSVVQLEQKPFDQQSVDTGKNLNQSETVKNIESNITSPDSEKKLDDLPIAPNNTKSKVTKRQPRAKKSTKIVADIVNIEVAKDFPEKLIESNVTAATDLSSSATKLDEATDLSTSKNAGTASTTTIKEAVENPISEPISEKTLEANANETKASAVVEDGKTTESTIETIIESSTKLSNRKTATNKKSKIKSSQSVNKSPEDIGSKKETKIAMKEADKIQEIPPIAKPSSSENDEDTNDDNIILAHIQKKCSDNADKSKTILTKAALKEPAEIIPSKMKSTARKPKSLLSKKIESNDETSSDETILEIKSIPKEDQKSNSQKSKASLRKESTTVSPLKSSPRKCKLVNAQDVTPIDLVDKLDAVSKESNEDVNDSVGKNKPQRKGKLSKSDLNDSNLDVKAKEETKDKESAITKSPTKTKRQLKGKLSKTDSTLSDSNNDEVSLEAKDIEVDKNTKLPNDKELSSAKSLSKKADTGLKQDDSNKDENDKDLEDSKTKTAETSNKKEQPITKSSTKSKAQRNTKLSKLNDSNNDEADDLDDSNNAKAKLPNEKEPSNAKNLAKSKTQQKSENNSKNDEVNSKAQDVKVSEDSSIKNVETLNKKESLNAKSLPKNKPQRKTKLSNHKDLTLNDSSTDEQSLEVKSKDVNEDSNAKVLNDKEPSNAKDLSKNKTQPKAKLSNADDKEVKSKENTEDLESSNDKKVKLSNEKEPPKIPSKNKLQRKAKPTNADLKPNDSINDDVILEVKSISNAIPDKSTELAIVTAEKLPPSKSTKRSAKLPPAEDKIFDSSDEELLPWDPEIGFVNREPIIETIAEKIPETEDAIVKKSNDEKPKTDADQIAAVPQTVPKQRKRRKNELAKIIADQLLESFKEVDQSRIEELKILHNLSIESNSSTADDLLISATLSATPPPKRKTAANIASDALVDLDTSFEEVDSESEAEIAKGNSATISKKSNETITKAMKTKAGKSSVIDQKKKLSKSNTDVDESGLDSTNKRKLTGNQLNVMKKQRRGNVNKDESLVVSADDTDTEKPLAKNTGKKQRRFADSKSDPSNIIPEVDNKVKKTRRTVVEKSTADGLKSKVHASETESTKGKPVSGLTQKTTSKKQHRGTDDEHDDDADISRLKDITKLQPITKPIAMAKSATKGRRHTICGKNQMSESDPITREKLIDTNAFHITTATNKRLKINEKKSSVETGTNIDICTHDTLLMDDKLLKAKIVVSTIKLAPVKPIILDTKISVPSVEVAPTVSMPLSEKKSSPPPITATVKPHGKIMKKGRGKRSPKKSQQIQPIVAGTKANVNDLVAQIINDFTTSTIDSPRKETPAASTVFGELTKTNLDLLNRTARNNELFNSLKYSTSKTDMEKLPEIGIATKQNHRPSYDHTLIMGRPKAVENLMQIDRLGAACMKSPMRAPFMSPRWEPGESTTDRFDSATGGKLSSSIQTPISSSSSSSSSGDVLIKEPILQKLWQPTKDTSSVLDDPPIISTPTSSATVVEKSLFQNVKEKTKKLFGKISKRKSKKSDILLSKKHSPTHHTTVSLKRPLLRPSILSTTNVFAAASTSIPAESNVDSCLKKLETSNLFLEKSVTFTDNLSTNIFIKDKPKTPTDSANESNLFEKAQMSTESSFKLFGTKDVQRKKSVAFPESELNKPIKVTAKKISQRRQTTTTRRSSKVPLPKPLTPPPTLHRSKRMASSPPPLPLDSLNTAFIQKRPQQTNRPIKPTHQSPTKTTKLSSIPSHIFTANDRCISPSSNSNSSSTSSGNTFLSQMVDKIRAANRDQQSESEEDLCLAAIAKSLNNKIMNTDEFNNELESPPAETANVSKPDFTIVDRSLPTPCDLLPSLIDDDASPSKTLDTNTEEAITNATPSIVERSEIDPDENTNTDLIDMDLEDCASVYTSFSIDTSFTAGGTAVRRKKRRVRKSIIYRKSKKSDVFLSPGDGHLCDICNKTFRSLGGLSSHKMTLSHISKLSEREFLQQNQANAESSETSSLPLNRSTLPPPSSSPTQLTPPLLKQSSTENANVRPIEHIEASVPIEDTTTPSNPVTVREPSASPPQHQQFSPLKSSIVSPKRVPPSPQQPSIPYMCQSGIEPISSPEQLDFSYDRYALPTRKTTTIADNSRLALSQEERLFYECCSMLKGSDRSVMPSSALGIAAAASNSPIGKFYPSGGIRMSPLDEHGVMKTKPVTPKSNEQYSSYLMPPEHSKGIPKIDMNQFSDISSDSNPAYSCPQVPRQSDTIFANERISSNVPTTSSSSSLLNIVVDGKNQMADSQHEQRRHFPASLIGHGFTGAFDDVNDKFVAHTPQRDLTDNDSYLQAVMKQRSPVYGQRHGSYLSPINHGSTEHQQHQQPHHHRLMTTHIGPHDLAAGTDGKAEALSSPMDSPLHSTSSQSSTMSKPRTKAAMKGYENFKVSIPTTGLDMQQALNRSPNPTGCKLAALAEIALGNDVPHAVGLMRSPTTTSSLSIVVTGNDPIDSPSVVMSHVSLISPNKSEETVTTKPQLIISESENKIEKTQSKTIDQVPTVVAAVSSNKKSASNVKNNKETTGNRLGFKQKKKVPKTRQPIEKPTVEPRDIYDFEDSHDSMDMPIVSLSHSRTKITGSELTAAIQSITTPFVDDDDIDNDNVKQVDNDNVPKDDDVPIIIAACPTNVNDELNTAANSPASSYSDRDDFNYDSVSESESSASEPKPEPASRPASRISNRSAKSINNLQKKCLIMGRIFKTAKKSEIATVPEKPIREQVAVKKPLPKQELDKLFDSLRGNSSSGGGGGSSGAAVAGQSLSANLTSTSKKSTTKSTSNESKTSSSTNGQAMTPTASSSTSASTTQSDRKADEKAAKRDAARRSRKPREVANMEAEWGMSMEQIIDLIGVGQRKTQRRCAANKQRTFAETWSSDEYEEFHSTKDIIALIQEAEVKARRSRSRSAKNATKKKDDDDNDNEDCDDDKKINDEKTIVDSTKLIDNHQTNDEIDKKQKIPIKVVMISDSDPRRKSSMLFGGGKDKQLEKDKENKQSPQAIASAVKLSKDDKKKSIRNDDNNDEDHVSPSSTIINETALSVAGSKKQPHPQQQPSTKSKKSTTFIDVPATTTTAATVADSDDTDIDSEWSKSVKRSKIKNRRRTIAFHEDDSKIQTNTAKSKRNKTPPPPSSRKFDAAKLPCSSSSSQRLQLMSSGGAAEHKSTKKSSGDQKPMSRRKRMASEMLYYWSSSSDEEFGRIKPRENYDDDNLEQHGWIVGDSHKKLVTLLAHAKGKKIEDCGVKEAIHKKKS